ncbi:hypothetical protein CCAL9344_09085, partial [Campylobacter sp. RM9344]|nr:hypothetical protein [Campylobacter sp. RM6913]MBE3030324.1 hypothetical protein [Campylobacter sp. RM9344]
NDPIISWDEDTKKDGVLNNEENAKDGKANETTATITLPSDVSATNTVVVTITNPSGETKTVSILSQNGSTAQLDDGRTIEVKDGSIKIPVEVMESKNTSISAFIKDIAGNQSSEVSSSITVDNSIKFIDSDITLTVSEYDIKGGASSADAIKTESSSAVTSFTFTTQDGTDSGLLTNADTKVLWFNEDGKLVGKEASQGGATVIELSVDNNGQISTSLLKPVFHKDGEGNLLDSTTTKGVTVEAVNMVGSNASIDINVTINDSTPTSYNPTNNTMDITIANPKSNVTLVLDFSISMFDQVSATDKTMRVDAAYKGLMALLNDYGTKGEENVKVSLVAFSGKAATLTNSHGDTWMSINDAKAMIARYYAHRTVNGKEAFTYSLESSLLSGTNYDAALAKTMETFDKNGKFTEKGVENRIHFVSDGDATVSDASSTSLSNTASILYDGKIWNFGTGNRFTNSGSSGYITTNSTGTRFYRNGNIEITSEVTTDHGISKAEESIWREFLTKNGIIAESYKLGEDVNLSSLNSISYNGITGENTDAQEFSKLKFEAKTAENVNFVTKANGEVGFDLGADENGTISVEIDGKTYIYDIAAKTINGEACEINSDGDVIAKVEVVRDTGSKLVVDLAKGTYDYTADENVANSKEGETIDIKFTITDADGDSVTQTSSSTFVNPAIPETPVAPSVPTGPSTIGITETFDNTIDTFKGYSISKDGQAGSSRYGFAHYDYDKHIGSEDTYDTVKVGETINFDNLTQNYTVNNYWFGRTEMSDASSLDARMEHINRLDLGKGDNSVGLLNLSADDVLDMTDSIDTILKIDGDSNDTVTGKWEKSTDYKAEEGYELYESKVTSGDHAGETIYIQIDTDIKTDF